MRISDCSSDVCSSDLVPDRLRLSVQRCFCAYLLHNKRLVRSSSGQGSQTSRSRPQSCLCAAAARSSPLSAPVSLLVSEATAHSRKSDTVWVPIPVYHFMHNSPSSQIRALHRTYARKTVE